MESPDLVNKAQIVMKKSKTKKRIPKITQKEMRQFIRELKSLKAKAQPTKEDSKYLPV